MFVGSQFVFIYIFCQHSCIYSNPLAGLALIMLSASFYINGNIRLKQFSASFGFESITYTLTIFFSRYLKLKCECPLIILFIVIIWKYSSLDNFQKIDLEVIENNFSRKCWNKKTDAKKIDKKQTFYKCSITKEFLTNNRIISKRDF